MAVGATILGVAGTGLSADERAFLAEANPFGFILFSRNISDAEGVRRLADALRDAVGRDAPIFIDQEGGRVARLGPPLARAWAPPLDDVRRAGRQAARALWLRYRIIAAELRALGIDGNCAPVADIAGPHTHPFLRNRCYGTDAATVTRNARAVAEGLAAGGVLPVLKHIPGHGRATKDSHAALPIVEATREALEATDFAPFRALSDLPLAMTAHVVFRALDDRPATISPTIIAMIREEMGFSGCLMTDDISMGALSGPVGSLSAEARAAGCDIVLHCNGDLAEMEAVAAAAGTLDGESAVRAARALSARRGPEALDIGAAEEELRALLGGASG